LDVDDAWWDGDNLHLMHHDGTEEVLENARIEGVTIEVLDE